MKKKSNPDYEILKLLRQIPRNDLFSTIIDIVNGEYNFGSSFLRSLSAEEISLRLEKILIMGTRRYSPRASKPYYQQDQNLFLDYAEKFTEMIDQVNVAHIYRRNSISSNYDFLIKKVRLRECLAGNSPLPFKIKVSIIIVGLLATYKIMTGGAAELAADTSISYIPEPTAIVSQLIVEKNDEMELPSLKVEQIQTINQQMIHENSIQPDSVVVEETPIITNDISEQKETITEEPTLESEEISNEASEVTNKEKYNYILNEYELTPEEFRIIAAIVCAEAKPDSYEDAYCVINTMYNRTISKKWIRYTNDIYKKDVGQSLYYQAVSPTQFVVYESGRYKKYLDATHLNQYQALIDFLYTKEIKHNYLSFKSRDTKVDDSFQFITGGNNYHEMMDEADRLDFEISSLSR